MPYDEVTRETIHEMIRYFYTSIMKDEVLEPFFTKKLGPDVENGVIWQDHFTQLDNFWLMMMLGKPSGFQGDPFPAHAFLGINEREPFERWLKLFKEATNKFFVPEIADKFYKKADILAERFIANLGIDDDDEDW